MLFRNIIAITLCSIFTFSCKTSNSIYPTTRIPSTKSNAPRFKTDEEILQSIDQYKKELDKSPNDIATLVKLAGAYVEIKETDLAINTLERIQTLNYRDEPKIYSTLGALYRKKERYAKAIESYSIFKSLVVEDPGLHAKTTDIIDQLEFINELLSNPYKINSRPLPSPLNTSESEYLPQFTVDQSQIIFTRRYLGQEDLFKASKSDDGYTVIPIEKINTNLNEGAHTISADGSMIIFTHCNEKFGYGSCDLYQAIQGADGWKKPRNLGSIINTRDWESQPSLSTDGRTLYFVSNRQGTLGGSDIWKSELNGEGKWGDPVNLGPQINTASHDESPFIHPDNKTLYFRSKGYRGLGNFDIFMASKVEHKWSNIRNLGSPINSIYNDGALVVSLDGLKGYFASDSYNGQKLNHLEIFEFDLPEQFRPQPMTYIKGTIRGLKNKTLKAQIDIVGLDLKESVQTLYTDHKGSFMGAVPVGQNLLINIHAEGYVFYSDNVSFGDVRHGASPHIIDIVLEPISPKEDGSVFEPIILKNIFFESASAKLLDESDVEIQYLYNLLLEHPNIKIQITGHTDDVGGEVDNLKLSEERALSVKKALVALGIHPDRVLTNGKGESQPIVENNSDINRAQNRRTEFVIISN